MRTADWNAGVFSIRWAESHFFRSETSPHLPDPENFKARPMGVNFNSTYNDQHLMPTVSRKFEATTQSC